VPVSVPEKVLSIGVALPEAETGTGTDPASGVVLRTLP